MCDVLGFYSALKGSFNDGLGQSIVPTFKDEVLFISELLKIRGIVCPETSVIIYFSTMRKIPKDRGYLLHSGLNSREVSLYFGFWCVTRIMNDRI
jgi:hypothetical protein